MSDEALSEEDKELEERLKNPFRVKIIKFRGDLICKDSMGVDEHSLGCFNGRCRLYCNIETTESFLRTLKEGEHIMTITCDYSFRSSVKKAERKLNPYLGY